MLKNKNVFDFTPIFILSTARSGTTSLSNHLCQHPEIAGFQAEEHWGIHECSFISNWRYIFDNIDDEYNFFYFMQCFKESDIFRLSKVDEQIFYRKQPRDIIEVVKVLVEDFCKNEKSKFWLNNSPKQAFYVEELNQYFPDAYYIIIKRPVIDTVKSSVRKYENKSLKSMAKKVFRYRTDFDAIYHHKKGLKNSIEIEFDDFINQKEETLKRVIQFLGLDWDGNVLKNPYEIQSSFSNKSGKKGYFGKRDERTVRLLNGMTKLLPFSLIKKPIRKRWEKKKAKNFINTPFYYRLHPYSKYMKGRRFHREDEVE